MARGPRRELSKITSVFSTRHDPKESGGARGRHPVRSDARAATNLVFQKPPCSVSALSNFTSHTVCPYHSTVANPDKT